MQVTSSRRTRQPGRRATVYDLAFVIIEVNTYFGGPRRQASVPRKEGEELYFRYTGHTPLPNSTGRLIINTGRDQEAYDRLGRELSALSPR